MNKAAFETKYNDASTGIYKSGQSEGIGSDDHRTMIEDIADNTMFIDDNFIDEDSFASDSATKAPSQQSVKAYVASQAASLLIKYTRTITSAEILAGTTIDLVAAPGSGIGIAPIHFTISMDYNSSPYSGSSGVFFSLNSGTAIHTPDTVNILAATADFYQVIPPKAQNLTLNTPLQFRFLGTATGGNSDIKVTVYYHLITI